MKRVLGLLLVVFCFASCGKPENYVQDVPVNYNVTVTEFGLKAVNNVLVVPNVGVSGIIIVKTQFNGFVAFDACSSVNPEKKCKIVPDANGLTATDPCSGGKFSLIDGTSVKAPAIRPLKSYTISLQGNVLLNVRN